MSTCTKYFALDIWFKLKVIRLFINYFFNNVFQFLFIFNGCALCIKTLFADFFLFNTNFTLIISFSYLSFICIYIYLFVCLFICLLFIYLLFIYLFIYIIFINLLYLFTIIFSIYLHIYFLQIFFCTYFCNATPVLTTPSPH